MNKAHTTLGYLGLIPFVGLSGLAIAGQAWAATPLLNYAALILSFLGGAVWTRSLAAGKAPAVAVVSNVFVLLGWAALLLDHTLISPAVLAVLFVALYAYEVSQFGGEYSQDYRVLRLRLTAVVAACLLAAALFT